MAYTMAGKDTTLGPRVYKADPEERPLAAKSFKLCTELLRDGKLKVIYSLKTFPDTDVPVSLKPMSVEVVGKLEDTQAAFDLMISGKHTTKLVLTVA